LSGRQPSRRGERLIWNLQSFTWDDLLQRSRDRERVRTIVGWLAERSAGGGGRVLDIGSGTGTYSVALAEEGFRVVGLDFSPGMLRQARRKAGRAGLSGARLSFERADFNRGLPFADDTFDDALCVCALHCVDDVRAFMTEVRRVLKPGGVFLLVMLSGDPLRSTPREKLRTSPPKRLFWKLKRRAIRRGRWAPYGRDDAVAMLGEAGFDFLEERDAEGPIALLAGRPEPRPLSG
jgi:ubiquinone/menaquinone biosynthesis C-methylase UbiE